MNLKDLDALPVTVSVERAAAVLGIGRGLAYRLVRHGHFPVPILKLGRRVVVPTASLLRDLQRVERDARRPFDRHDTLVKELTDAAAKAHDSLLEGKEGDVFRERVRRCLDEFRSSEPKPDYPGGAVSETEFPQLVAQHIVNAIDKLPSHYTDATFWSRFGQEFLKLRRGQAFERLDKLTASLLKHDRNLQAWLDRKRGVLVDRYDVPAAPMTGAVSEDR